MKLGLNQVKNFLQLSILFTVVKAIADQKALLDFKTGIFNTNFNFTALFFVNQCTGANRLCAVFYQVIM